MASFYTEVDQDIAKLNLDPNTRKMIWNGDIDSQENPSVSTEKNFGMWYRNTKNTVDVKSIILKGKVKTDGSKTYGGINFFPFDKNYPLHNYYFTCEHHGKFIYRASENQYFKLSTANDGWLFINGELRVDLGGAHPDLERIVYLNSMNLMDRKEYDLDIFYANRNPPKSALSLNTNICLGCKNGYDECGVCKTNRPGCSYKCLERYVVDEKCDYKDEDLEGYSVREESDPCTDGNCELNLFQKLQKNMQCYVESVSDREYKFKFHMDREYPETEKSALVVGLSNYNQILRERNICDNRESDYVSAWSDVSKMWNANVLRTETSESDPISWTVSSRFLNPDTKRTTLEAITTSEDLLRCNSPEIPIPRITRVETTSNASRGLVYGGVWTASRVIPHDILDEGKGESVLSEIRCSFRILEINNSTNAIVFQITKNKEDSPKLHVESTWISAHCNANGDLTFSLKTCSSVIGRSEYGSKLAFYDVGFQMNNATLDSLVALNITVDSLESENYGNCGKANETWKCCQKWMVVVKDLAPGTVDGFDLGKLFKSTLVLEWTGFMYKTSYDAEHSKTAHDSCKVSAHLELDIKGGCDTVANLEVESELDGHLDIYKDSELTHKYVSVLDKPFEDCDTVFVKLSPDLSNKICSNYQLMVTQVFMVYNKTDETQAVASNWDLIYDVDSEHVNQVHNSGVDVYQDGNCYAKIHWNAFRPDCHANPSERPIGNEIAAENDETESDYGKYKVEMWDGERFTGYDKKEFLQSDEKEFLQSDKNRRKEIDGNDKEEGEETDDSEDDSETYRKTFRLRKHQLKNRKNSRRHEKEVPCDVEIVVKWEIVPIVQVGLKKRSLSAAASSGGNEDETDDEDDDGNLEASEKRAYGYGNAESLRPRRAHTGRGNYRVECRLDQFWDWTDGRCIKNRFHYWKRHVSPVVWTLFAAVLFFLVLLVLGYFCIPCLSSREKAIVVKNVSSKHRNERHQSHPGHHMVIIYTIMNFIKQCGKQCRRIIYGNPNKTNYRQSRNVDYGGSCDDEEITDLTAVCESINNNNSLMAGTGSLINRFGQKATDY